MSVCIIHLGLPVGPNLFIKNYLQDKLKSTVRAFYSLNGIGPYKTCPRSYMVSLTQATLIKMNLTLSKYALLTPLMNALRIETIKLLYLKFKILFVRQLKRPSPYQLNTGFSR